MHHHININAVLTADPYLEYQPAFAYTLPIQLLVVGITLTLLVLLLIHLLFTTQYHYPLAPLNYCLQLASILSVLISVIVKIVVILSHSEDKADVWPYYLDYVAVPVPRTSWTTGEDAAWFLLQAINNGLANITHIQFLTLLYPSRTEARLIFFILGPLAIASSGLFFCALSPSRTVLDLGDAIRNVFSSTLLLIFTLSLCIWGFLVNRRRAWRLDGGTAVFGAGALGLAFVTTATSFVSVKEEGIDWLQHLIWAAVLWQTWLGWWWWVGAGMGIGEVEDIMQRADRKRRKAARKAHRSGVTGTSGSARGGGAASIAGMVKNASSTFTSGFANLFPASTETTRRRNVASHGRVPRSSTPGREPDIEEGIELGELGDVVTGSGSGSAAGLDVAGADRSRRTRQVEVAGPAGAAGTGTGTGTGTGNGSARQHLSSNSETSSTSRTPSLHPPRTITELVSFPTTWMQVYFRRLRRAHEDATRRRAVEQAERRARVAPASSSAGPAIGVSVTAEDTTGWGLGSFGIREHQESAWRLQQAGRQIRAERLLNNDVVEEGDGGNEGEEDLAGEEGGEAPVAGSEGGDGIIQIEAEGDGDVDWEDIDSTASTPSRRGSHEPTPRRVGWLLRRGPTASTSAPPAAATSPPETGTARGEAVATATAATNQQPTRHGEGSGWSWWGPLKDWRLADRSIF